jgi:hypothetical protein
MQPKIYKEQNLKAIFKKSSVIVIEQDMYFEHFLFRSIMYMLLERNIMINIIKISS